MTATITEESEVDVSEADLLIERDNWDDFVESLSPSEAIDLFWDWQFWSRPSQRMPTGDWDVWLIRAGRGFGKTRTGAETVRQAVLDHGYRRIGIVAPTAGDARDVMVEGESGILAVHPPGDRPLYEPSKRRLTWPNGAIGTLFSAEKPDRIRGPEHDFVWCDEPASMPRGEDAVDNARLGLRIGKKPRMVITGTPKPVRWLRDLAAEPVTVETRGSTYANLRHLAPSFIRVILGRYEGTRLGRQELYAEWLEDVEGALWTELMLHESRMVSFDRDDPWESLNAWLEARNRKKLKGRKAWRTIVAVDPPGETAECGIIVATAPVRATAGLDHMVVLEDMSMEGRPEDWGEQVVTAFRKYDAERVVIEKNMGHDMVRSTVHAVDNTVPVEKVNAQGSKKERAEPVSALYGKGWIHHVGHFPELEEQQTTWVHDESPSPDRVDAVVHAARELLKVKPKGKSKTASPRGRNL